MEGTVKFFTPTGWGFIESKDGSGDHFVHVSGLKHAQTLEEGQEVSYELIPDPKGKGPRAVSVVIIG